tara:strand:- start:3091 stop:8529 length:5439 start_codon:yes stop_codon:yes gene_type:complete
MTDYTEQLKKYWKTESLSFIAVFTKFKEKEGFFNDLINPVSLKKLYYPEVENVKINQKKVSFYVPNATKFINGQFYKIDVEYSDSAKRNNNPYSLQVSSISHLNQQDVEKHLSGALSIELLKRVFQIKSFIDKDISEQHIKQRFERRTKDPDGNKIIANLMLEIGAGMYSSKQRMIFELLQNADDAPGKEKVEFHIDINGDYFFVMHDGVSFSKEDINAITSAAQSTKKKDKKKTGYKGIGFKSVFTNSTEVWLKSGGYQFAFLRNSSLFKNFDDFYFSSDRYKKYPEFIDEDKLLYVEQREQFNSSTDIPWQIIPIWQDKLPSEFNDSNFSDFDNPVQFALKVGTNHIYSDDGYLNAIDNIVKRPQFLLFLRNTSKFRSPKNRVTLTRRDNENLIEIEKTIVEYIGNKIVYHQDKFNYLKISYPDIEVSNESFLFHKIDLKKSIRVINQSEVYEFVDLNDDLIETIPPKLATVNETEISFGIKFTHNNIAAEDGYSNSLDEYSSLFTYLPMEDKRFKLPFLVNADFIPDSRRESLQGDNPWNKYIMIRIAEKHIETIAHYTSEFIKDNTMYTSYLSLLLRKLLPEDDTAQQIIDSYNATYLEKLENTEIVVNDSNQTQLLSNTILDDSGLIELFGQEIFYEIIETDKRLPHSNLDAKYLKEYEYLNVEVVNLELLAAQISPYICESLGSIIAQNSLYEKTELLKWLNKIVKYIPAHFGKIPFIVHNDALFSLERLIDEEDAWLINEHTSQHTTLIEELGFHIIQLNLDKYSNIKEYLHSVSGYINDKTLAYERIASNSNLHKLPIISKLKLIDFLQNSDFMKLIGPVKYFGELKLFVDESNTPRPLFQLLSRKEDLEVNSIDKFRVKESEYNNIPDALRKELIVKNKIFTSFILDEDLFKEWSQQFDTETINSYIDDLQIIYSWEEAPEDIHHNKWPSIPWIFIDDETRFVTSDKVYWSKAFNDLSADKFEVIKSVLHSKEVKILPVQECGSLIKAFPIKTDDSSEIDWSEVEELEMLVANTLLDWMEDDGGFGDFFKNYTLVSNTKNTYEIEEIEDIKIFDGTDKALKTYIQSNTELSGLFNELDSNVCSENRSIIGLLQGDRLIKALIESSEYDQNLALHLPSNVSPELLYSFITKLKEFKLLTDSEYDGGTPEHLIINRLLKSVESVNDIPPELQSTIKVLRGKTTIDGNPLSNYTVSDRVSYGKKEDRKVLKLSDILTEFQGESDVLDNVKKSFTAITQKAKSRELFFKTIPLTPIEIHTRIESENSTYYTVYQVAFQLLDKKYGGRQNWSKQRFNEYFINQGSETQLHNSYGEFLDVLIELPFTEISDFTFQNLILNNCVDKNFAIESECIPSWLEDWVKKDQINRLEFLSKLGYSGTDSAIVNLRKSMIAKEYDQNSVIRYFEESKSNMPIIWNTILWLTNYNSKIVTQNILVIKQVNDYIRFKSESIEQITVPIIKSIDAEGQRAYYLHTVNCETELLKINIQSEFSDSILSSLNSSLNKPHCVDEHVGKLSDYLNITAVQLEESVDLKSLESKSKLWEEPFYIKWEHRSDYPIYIYDGGEIPYKRTFNNITINTFTQDYQVANDGKFYISKVFIKDIVDNLPESFPKEILNDLKDWERKILKNPSLIEIDFNPFMDITPADETFIRSIIHGDFELNEKLDANTTAKIKTLMAIKGQYNTSEISDKERFLKAGSDEIIVRSAQNGLLYLDVYHWGRLGEDKVRLSVYTNNQIEIFTTQDKLISYTKPQNKFGIVRMPSEYDVDYYNSLDNVSDKGKWHYVFIVNENTRAAQKYQELMNLDDYNF